MSIEDSADAQELKMLLEKSTQPRVRALLEGRLFELTRASASAAAQAAPSASASAPTPVGAGSISAAATVYTTPRYGWEQNNEFVTVLCFELTGVGAVKSDVSVQFTARGFSMTIPSLGGKAYALRVPQLEKDIVPAQSSFKVKKNSVEIALRKAGQWDHWTTLALKSAKAVDASSKADPSAGIMDMMKNMYDEGTPEVKKMIGEAMLKSQAEKAAGGSSSTGFGAGASATNFDADFGAEDGFGDI
jgi:calcyclin binding protein